jgi:glycosyltransferase involved in cell wall biosynthesis
VHICEIGTGIFSVPPVGYGGTERVIYSLSIALSKRVKCSIIDFTKKGPFEVKNEGDIVSYKIPFRLNISKVNRISYFINAVLFGLLICANSKRLKNVLSDADIFHLHGYVQVIIFSRLKKALRLKGKIVYTVHSPRWMEPETFSRIERLVAHLLEYRAMKMADLVTFECPFLKKSVADFFGKEKMDKIRSTVLYNGVDSNGYINPEDPSQSDPLKIVWAARFHKQKNQSVVVDAIPKVVQKFPQATFVFIGDIDDKNYYDAVQEKIHQLRISSNVAIIKSVPYQELKEWYAKCGIHLVFSKYTGFDVALGENLACGRALVASKIPTVEGLLEHRVNSILVDPDDACGLSSAIIELIENDNLRMDISRRARELAVGILEWREIVNGFLLDLKQLD